MGSAPAPPLLPLLLLLLLPWAYAADIIAGTDTFNDLGTALARGFRRVSAGYQSVGSQSAITGFNAGGIAVAVSDVPTTPDQDSAARSVSRVYGRYTVPLVMGTYGFFANMPRGAVVRLTAQQTWAMYSAGGDWRQYGGPTTGPVVRFARGDSCGANLIMKKYWAAGANATVALDEGPLIYPDVVYVTGAKAMCESLLMKPGGIAYSLTGLCMRHVALGLLVEVALQQGNGAFIPPSRSRPEAAIPRVLPPEWMSWTSVANQMLLSKAKFAPPIVVFQYAFIRRWGLRVAGPQAILAREFLLYMVQTAPAVARAYGFIPVPKSIETANMVALRAVKLY